MRHKSLLGVLCFGLLAANVYAQTPVISAVINSGDFSSPPLAPGSQASIFGSNLASTTATAATVPLPFTLGGASILVNGTAAALFFASSGQINFQIPYEAATGNATITVTSGGSTSAGFLFPVVPAAPGISNIQNPSGSPNTAANPIAPGATATVFFTGLGATNPAVADGAGAPSSPKAVPVASSSVTVGGQAATVPFIGLTPGLVGQAQANVTVPAGLAAGSYAVIVTVNGNPSRAATIYVSGPAPTITSVAPNTTPVTSPATQITISGTFGGGSTVSFTPPGLSTTSITSNMINAAQILATIPAAQLTSAGTAQVAITNALGAVSNQVPFTITGMTQTITFDAVPNQILGISPFVLAAQASSGLPVGFVSTTPAVCKLAGNLLTLRSAGSCSITASQPGNTVFNPATSVTRSFTVSRAKISGSFMPAAGSPFVAGSGSGFVAAGDFNADGIPDLAVANQNDNTVTILLGNGSGGFTAVPGSPFAVGVTPVSVAVGDFNGDGIQDLAVTNGGGNSVTVLLGNGSGGFAPALGSPFAAGSEPVSVVVGDFNGDGILDLSVANRISNNITVLLGNGSGGFNATALSPPTGGLAAFSLVVGDFNGDGNLDIATANRASSNVTVLLGNGSGGFTAAPGSPFSAGAGTGPISVVVGDFNGDGIPDLATANSVGFSVTILLGNGSGGFTAATGSPFAVGTGPFSVVVGDFNGDGIQDLAVPDFVNNNVTVLLGNGSGGFTAMTGSPLAVGSEPSSIVVGDFNGDGIEDLAVANFGDTTVTVLLGFVVGTTPQTITFGPLTGVTYGVAPFTVSATSTSALAVSFASTTSVSIPSLISGVCTVSGNTVTIIGAGTCTITASQAGNATYAAAATVMQSFTVSPPPTPVITSVTPNTALTGSAATPITINGSNFGGAATVSFTPPGGAPVTIAPSTILAAQIAATIPSALLSSAGTAEIAINNGLGTLSNQVPFTITNGFQSISFDKIPNQILGVSPFVIAAQASSLLPVGFISTTPAVCRTADDLVQPLSAGTCSITASQPGNGVSYRAAISVTKSFAVSRGTTGTTLTAAPGSPDAVGNGPFAVATGDFNGDGISDLATANAADNTVTVLLGNGSGGFTAAPGSPFSAGTGPFSLAVGDFNGDGFQDLAVVDLGPTLSSISTITILLGNGVGGFAAATGSPYAVGTEAEFVAVGDFNGDGIQDLAISNAGSNNVTLLLGNGSGGFTTAAGSPFAVGTHPGAVAVGDFNQDGIEDLGVANQNDNTITVLLGNGSGGFTPVAGSPFAVGTNPIGVVVGDFNGDGIPDLATANPGSNDVTVLLGSGSGGFTPATGSPFAVGSVSPISLAVGDFNGDVVQDLVVANGGFTATGTPLASNNVTLLLGNGSGGFAPASGSPFSVGTNPTSVVVGDFNRDGILDLAAANDGSNNVTVLLGTAPVIAPPSGPPPLTISSSAGSISTTPGGSVSAKFSASGGTPPYTFTASGLPAGVTLTSSGSLSGSASQAGSFTASVTVTDANRASASTSITINVLGLTTTSLPAGTVGQVYFASLAASGGSGISFAATGLPPGLSISGAGAISGTPKTAGVYTLVVTISSGGASAIGNVSLTIAQPKALSISSATPPNGTVGVLYSQALTASGGLPPYTWSVISGAPPQGFSLSASGVVSGMPATAGAFMFGVQVTDTAGATATATASFTIQPAPLTITTKSLPSGMNTVDYPQQQLAATGGVAPYTWALGSGGSLPAGMLLSTSGVLSGVPTAMGMFPVTVTVTDSSAAKTPLSATFTLTIRATAPDLILTTGALGFSLMSPATSPSASQSVGVQATVASAIVAYTASVSPAVPWLAISNGTATPDSIQVSITSAALTLSPGSYQTTITATCTSSSCNGHTQSVSVSLTVTAAPPILQISTDLLSFATTNTALGSLSQPINVQNVGGGSLGFASVSCEAPWCTAAPPMNLGGGVSASIPVTVNPSSLSPGFYRTQVDIMTSGGQGSVPVTLFISANATMTLAPAGGLFNQNAGSAPGNPNGSFLVSVNSPTPVNYTATVLPGASWLVVGTTGGMSTSAQPGTVNYSINPAVSSTLATGAYYGEIQITSGQVSDSPQDFEVVLNVAPAVAPVTPDPEPGGLLFLTTVGGVLPPQTVTVYSGSAAPLTFQASAATISGGGWLSVTPTMGTASQSAPGVTTVSVNASKLSAGVYHGGVSYSLSATAVRTVGVTLIVSSSAATSSAVSSNAQPKASGCTPSKLVPAQTGLVDSFFSPAGWPTPLQVLLFDDCGSVVNNGQIVATFSNGDPPLALPLANAGLGLYSGTWSPANPSSQVTIGVTASAPNFATAISPLTGAVVPNAVPLLAPNRTLHVFDSLVGGALAPGTIVEIFGQNLAATTSTASAVPLPGTMNGSSVIIGGMQAPLYYVSPGQIDAQIPFELPPAQQYQVIVSANGALTTPQPIQLSAAAPGLATEPDGTLIAQHSDGSLVTAMSPAVAGEYIVAYLAGLGDTTVPVTSGTASPTSPLALPSNSLVLTIDGAPSPLLFAGLTPGLVGLYQMNFQVPAGLPAGNLTISVSQDGQPSNQTVLPYHP